MRALTMAVDTKYTGRDPLVSSDTDAVNARCIAYEKMMERWELPDDLVGGTITMRQQADKWLPKEEKETEDAWNCRVARAVLYEAYRIQLEKLSNKPFSRPITIKGTLPAPIKALIADADRSGVSLSALAEEMLFCGMHYGLTHIVADYPPMPPNATKQDEIDRKARPVFVHIPASRLFSWSVVTQDNGTQTLESIRILEQRTEKVGARGQKTQYYIREYTVSGWEVFKEVENTADGKTTYTWISDSRGSHTFGRVPLYTLYTRRTGFMCGTPAFEAIAWLNLAHFQSMSDQRNILRFARLGLLFGAGFTEEEIANGLNIGPSAFLGSTNVEAKLTYVESTGAAMQVGRDDLEDLEGRMEGAGMEALRPAVGGESATGRASDELKGRSYLQIWVKALEELLHKGLTEVAAWIGQSIPDLSVDIYNDFTLSPRSRDDMLALLEARANGEIGRERFWKEWQRRGMFEEMVDIPAEVKKAIEDLIADMQRNQEYGGLPASRGSSRLGGTGGSGARTDMTDTNGGNSSRKGENKGKRGNSVASGTTGA